MVVIFMVVVVVVVVVVVLVIVVVIEGMFWNYSFCYVQVSALVISLNRF